MPRVILRTQSGSIYAVDREACTMERLLGVGPATARVGDGARRFEVISEIQVGAPVIVNWGRFSATPSQTEGADPCTVTSRVVSIDLEVGI